MIEEAGTVALRHREWKYVKPLTEGWQKASEGLYNLKDDPSEQMNLLSEHPEKTQAMKGKLAEMIKSKGIRQR